MRMHLKKKRKFILLKRLIVVIFFLIVTICILDFGKNITEYYLSYAESEVKVIAKSINDSYNAKMIDYDNLYNIVKNDSGEIIMIDYNNKKINEYSSSIKKQILKKLYNSKKKGTYIYVPMLSIFKNSMVTGFGPKIPVKIEFIGVVTSNPKIDVKDYGINSSLIKLSLEVEFNYKLTLPLNSKNFKSKSSIVLSYKIINGNIPNFYYKDNKTVFLEHE